MPFSDYLDACLGLAKRSLETITNDPILNLRKPGISTAKLASKMLLLSNIGEIGVLFGNKMYEIIKYHKQLKKEEMFQRFHLITVDEKLCNEFFLCLNEIEDLQPRTVNAVYQIFIDNFLKESINYCLPPKVTSLSVNDFRMSKDEEATLRYVAGYLVFSLKKKVDRKTSAESKAILLLRNQFSKCDNHLESEVSLLEYTSHWVDQVNRGGLMIINDQFYAFVKLLEHATRVLMNKNLFFKYCGEDLRKILIELFKKNGAIQDNWSNLTRELRNKDLGKKVLKAIFKKWANIRAYAFVKNWMERRKVMQFKKGEDVAEKAEPALRKTLKAKRSVKSNK